jgi:four helix bundle protein
MAFTFEKLEIWKKSFLLAEEINTIIKGFPSYELFNLSNQILRAADSIGLNIAESSVGNTTKEQLKFLQYASRSITEVVACLLKAKSRGYIDINQYEILYALSVEVYKMLASFKRAVAARK